MHRIDTSGSVGGMFTDGQPGNTEATVVGEDWLNALQEEVVAVVLASGASLSKPDNTQLRTALVALFGRLATANTWTATNAFSAGLTGTTAAMSGAVSGTTGTFSAAVSGTTGTFSGAVAGAAGTFSGPVNATGTGAGAGVTGTGGASSGAGGAFVGGETDGAGLTALGQGTGPGASMTGGEASAPGGLGTGGAPNGNGYEAIGSGNGNGMVATAFASGSGIGAVATGPTAGGSFANSNAASAGTRRTALRATNGDLSFAGVTNPAATTAHTNALGPANVPKAWAKVTTNGLGGVTLVSGFNITSAALSGGDLVVTFASAFADANYVCVDTLGSAAARLPRLWSQTTTTATFRLLDTSGVQVSQSGENSDHFIVAFGLH